jgi:hypothetical protein
VRRVGHVEGGRVVRVASGALHRRRARVHSRRVDVRSVRARANRRGGDGAGDDWLVYDFRVGAGVRAGGAGESSRGCFRRVAHDCGAVVAHRGGGKGFERCARGVAERRR